MKDLYKRQPIKFKLTIQTSLECNYLTNEKNNGYMGVTKICLDHQCVNSVNASRLKCVAMETKS